MEAQRATAAVSAKQKVQTARLGSREAQEQTEGRPEFGEKKKLSDAEQFAKSLSDASLLNIIVKMQNPLSGVPLRDQCWRMRTFAQCFTGAEAVRWLLAQGERGISTPELAVAVGARLQAVGAFRPLSRAGHAFADNEALYQLKGLAALEDMRHLDDVFKEYLVYRGLADTLQAFDAELASDRLQGFQGARLTAKLLQLVHEFDLAGFRALWAHLDRVLFSRLDGKYQATVDRLEFALQRYYLVCAVQNKKAVRVHEFFREQAALASTEKWQKWFTLPYYAAPHKHPDFEVYFTKQWAETVSCSLTNFLTTVLQEAPLPKALLFNVERVVRTTVEKEVLQLRAQVARLEQQLGILEHERQLAAAEAPATHAARVAAIPTLRRASPAREQQQQQQQQQQAQQQLQLRPPERNTPSPPPTLAAPSLEVTPAAAAGQEARKSSHEKVFLGKQRQSSLSAELPPAVPQAAVVSTQSFTGHGSKAVRALQVSSGGSLVASGSVDGTVKVWPLSDVAEEIATISCFARVTGVAWGRGSERILLVGSKMGTARMWDVKDESLLAEMALPHAVDAICCGKGTICACVSSASDSNANSSVFLYDMQFSPPKLCQEMLPNPPTHLHCTVINKAGTQLLAGGENGFIYAFDTATYAQTHWRAHFGPVRALCYDKQGSTVVSIGKDRNLLQWNLLSTGTPQLSYTYNNATAHASISFSPFGDYFLANENECLNIYKLSTPEPVQSLPQGSAVACVGWHPSANICLVGTEAGHVQVLHLKLAK